MKSSRYSPEQVAFAMRQAESGTLVLEFAANSNPWGYVATRLKMGLFRKNHLLTSALTTIV